MDDFDRKILTLLQQDASLSVAEIADRVGLSSTPCWRRIQKLEGDGIIKHRVAILDPDKINVGVTVFVSIRTQNHNIDWLDRFSKAVEDIDEVVEFYRMK